MVEVVLAVAFKLRVNLLVAEETMWPEVKLKEPVTVVEPVPDKVTFPKVLFIISPVNVLFPLTL